MFQMLPESSGRLVALRVAGKLTKEDMVSVAPPVEEKIRENGKVDLLCDMTDLHGWSLGGVLAGVKFYPKNAENFPRLAVHNVATMGIFVRVLSKGIIAAGSKNAL